MTIAVDLGRKATKQNKNQSKVMHSDQVLGGKRQELFLNAKNNRLLVLCMLI